MASETQKANAAGKMYMRVKRHLIENDRVNLAVEHGVIQAQGAKENRQWIEAMGSIKFIPWVMNGYDLGIHQMKIIYSNPVKILKVTLHVKCRDEGFEGGQINLEYENERMREEIKIANIRNTRNN